jgi:hypothetical protein
MFRVFGIGIIVTIAALAMNVTPTSGTETMSSQQDRSPTLLKSYLVQESWPGYGEMKYAPGSSPRAWMWT